MSIDRNCLNCGAKLHKDDILCLECETPVLTEDDITLMPNAAATRVMNELEYTGSPYSDSVPPADKIPSGDAAPPVDLTTSEPPGIAANTSAAPTADTMLYMDDADQLDKVVSNKKSRIRVRVPQRLIQSWRAPTQRHKIPKDDKKRPPKKSGRNAVVVFFVIILGAALGVGLFFLLRPSPVQFEEPGATVPVTDADEDTANTGDNADTVQFEPPATPQEDSDEVEVTSIVLYRDGRAQTEFHTMLDEVITLRAQIIPESSTAAVTWKSSDPDVLEIISFGPNGMEASVVGKAPGVVDIIVSAGNFEMSYIVFVDDLPMHIQLENAVKNRNEPLWLTITWTSGQHNGEETVFEWDVENREWIMDGAYNRSDPEPVFDNTHNAFTLGFSDTPRVFYFFADGTGHYRNPDGTDDEDFVWIFKTTQIEPEG